MIKFYKSISDFAKEHWICRQTASSLIKWWKLNNVMKLPKNANYIEITLK